MNISVLEWIIMGSDRRPETKQGEIVRLRSGMVSDNVSDRDSDRRSEPDCRPKAINFGAC